MTAARTANPIDRLGAIVRALPPAQRAGIVVAGVVLIMAAVPFFQWITTPSYALLYTELDDRELAEVTTELDATGVDYRLEGARVLVPRDELHRTRATLAEAGVSGTPTVPGYELLDAQSLGVSDFRQRVDLQRAWEGELTRTLQAMDAIDMASVRLVIPEDALFAEQQTPPSAAVLVRTRTSLSAGQIDAITLLVSSAVEGLDANNVTVTDTDGTVLHAPGDGIVGGVTDRQQRMTREFEESLAADLGQILQRATNAPASAVVRASLDFDESETETEAFTGDPIVLREQTSEESYEGANTIPGGVVGVDGGPLPDAQDSSFDRQEESREYGVGRTTTRTVRAPGDVESLHVAVVVDESTTLTDAELTSLIGAALGIETARGDQVAITRASMPEADTALEPERGVDIIEIVQRVIALVVLLVVALGLVWMLRRRRESPGDRIVPAELRASIPLDAAPPGDDDAAQQSRALRDDVARLVEQQPEEIAALLRGWLADRRAHS